MKRQSCKIPGRFRLSRVLLSNLSQAVHKSCAIALMILLVAPFDAAQTHNFAYMGTVAGEFGTIDLNTGVFTLLGNTGFALSAMAVSSGKLYGASYPTVSGDTLYTINPANGNLTPVGNSSVEYDDFQRSVCCGCGRESLLDRLLVQHTQKRRVS